MQKSTEVHETAFRKLGLGGLSEGTNCHPGAGSPAAANAVGSATGVDGAPGADASTVETTTAGGAAPGSETTNTLTAAISAVAERTRARLRRPPS